MSVLVFIVAEIGVNFRSFPELVLMMQLAKDAGADAVKLQCYDHDTLVKVYPGGEVERHPMYDKLMVIQLTREGLHAVKKAADSIGIEIFATPMYVGAVNILEEIGVKRYKVRYADRHNEELLQKVISTSKQVMISCDENYHRLTVIGNIHNNLSYMFCIPKYPPELDDFINVPYRFSIHTFTGYSNHYPSIIPALIAVSRGCQILEMHVKRDGTEPIDNAVSITFEQFRELVKIVREMEIFATT